MLFTLIKNILSLFNLKEKMTVVLVFLMGTINSFLDTLSIGAILPLAYTILDTKKAADLFFMKDIYKLPFVNTETDFILFVSISFFALYLLKCIYGVFYSYIQGSSFRNIYTKYSMSLYNYYQNRPYEFYFTNNASVLHRRVMMMVRALISGVVNTSIQLIEKIITSVFLFVMVLYSGTRSIMVIALVMFIIFIVLYAITQRSIKNIAVESNAANRKFYRLVQEYFQGIKSLRILGRSDDTTEIVKKYNDKVNVLGIKRDIISRIPSEILECFTVGVLIYILVANFLMTKDLHASIASISLCSASAFKLKSVFSSIIMSASQVRDNIAYYDEIYDDLKNATIEMEEREEHIKKEKSGNLEISQLNFSNNISFENISYKYPETTKYIFENASMNIKKGEVVGIMGQSGTGKSTFADMLLGLLIPEKGEIKIDETNLIGNEEAWRNIVGYVPQTIFMMDSTIMENVALGIEVENIDREKVRKVLSIAQLGDFIETLKDKEDTIIGDNGIRLSGGQRQRIGIARALYNEPEVLIFDESTSSLDIKTEESFIETINNMRDDYTIIMIAHRMETLKYCDIIYELKDKNFKKKS